MTRHLAALGRSIWEFVVGDDWRIAAGVVAVLAGGAVLVSATRLPDGVVAVLVAVGIAAVAIGAIAGTALGRRR